MLRRGEVWEVTGQRRRTVLVVSHGMYNDQPGISTVLTMPVLTGTGDELGTWCVPIGAGQVAVVDHVGPTAKAVFERRVRVIDTQVVMDVNNALFKILSTN
ncbi:MAG: type II toxin-antitoxin system PemK/MazF family toxin [Pseudonocardiaceae bacterium]